MEATISGAMFCNGERFLIYTSPGGMPNVMDRAHVLTDDAGYAALHPGCKGHWEMQDGDLFFRPEAR